MRPLILALSLLAFPTRADTLIIHHGALHALAADTLPLGTPRYEWEGNHSCLICSTDRVRIKLDKIGPTWLIVDFTATPTGIDVHAWHDAGGGTPLADFDERYHYENWAALLASPSDPARLLRETLARAGVVVLNWDEWSSPAAVMTAADESRMAWLLARLDSERYADRDFACQALHALPYRDHVYRVCLHRRLTPEARHRLSDLIDPQPTVIPAAVADELMSLVSGQ